MILCWYSNMMGGLRSWIFDPSSNMTPNQQWLRTMRSHDSWVSLENRFKTGNFSELVEREY